MRRLKNLATLLIFLIVMMFSIPAMAGEYKVTIANNTDKFIAFASVVRLEFVDGSHQQLKEMKLHWSEWLEPMQEGILYMREGIYYAVYIEVWRYNVETKKMLDKVGESYREGVFNHKESGDRIDINASGQSKKQT